MRYTSSRPDGYLLRADAQSLQANDNSSGRYRWSDIAVVSEYKCGVAMTRFVLGFTIEDNDMRLYFRVSHADFVVSESFRFISDCETFTGIFLALLYRRESDLCWGPSIRLVKDDDVPRRGYNNTPVYDITVYDQESKGSATYRTTRVLPDGAANDLHGRCTRMFAARRVENGQVREGEPEVVIKDSWRDEDRRNLHEEDPHRIENGNEDEEDGLEDYLLTVLYHGDVEISPGVHDHTRKVMVQGKDLAKNGNAVPSTSTSFLAFCLSICPLPRRTACDLRDLAKATVAVWIIPLLSALNSGNILRSITIVSFTKSLGNLLLYGERVELADWEYVSHKKHAGVHEIRTGTAYFMAVEVDKQEYLFLPPRPVDKEKVLKQHKRTLCTKEAKEKHSVPQDAADYPESIPFQYLPLHDIESAVVAVDGTAVEEGTTPGQQLYTDSLFLDGDQRFWTLAQNTWYRSATRHLHAAIRPVAYDLYTILTLLVIEYRNAEADAANIVTEVSDDVYGGFAGLLLQGEKDKDITLGPEMGLGKNHRRAPT
ncbi:hypothetical protein WOLCODRAFT_144253 [Wolfiporia cocos MD-104 SS10]|uniref:Fungal-type protein kinase domain-containing protein n=1 Tax=Wolfiporia cocos (strain MD-104) TaxID=742152 RepID=A0A2H3JL14_WOLCO|nr:hypothetical protein WOLCODRAFT_144253 [Wolfiporia cocos MD-104 SS10]